MRTFEGRAALRLLLLLLLLLLLTTTTTFEGRAALRLEGGHGAPPLGIVAVALRAEEQPKCSKSTGVRM